ncbi:hypothetical protein ARSEF1564_007087 [Beauveria bassiana]
MRLLNTKSYELYEHHEHSSYQAPLPPHAVLSHTWLESDSKGVKEVIYQDMKNSFLSLKHGTLKPHGWSKLTSFCDRAREDGWEWAWMDTCCIDKTSTGDTQEAINAMFRWYRDAAVCYAHLADVCLGASADPTGSSPEYDRNDLGSRLARSRWFTRGWTLQELVAPRHLRFVDCDWKHIGTRENWAREIEWTCDIGTGQLVNFEPENTRSSSLAMRLSWASRRETTVEEGETYCLLGIFGISMPLVYGEGRTLAFTRFQHELIRNYDDDSIFAWAGGTYICNPLGNDRHGTYSPVLAPSIRCFQHASNFQSASNSFYMTNRGLRITGQLGKIEPFRGAERADSPKNIYFLLLNSRDVDDEPPYKHRIGIALRRNGDGDYQRIVKNIIYTPMGNEATIHERLTISKSFTLSELDTLPDGFFWLDPSKTFLQPPCQETITIRNGHVQDTQSWGNIRSILRFEYPESCIEILGIFQVLFWQGPARERDRLWPLPQQASAASSLLSQYVIRLGMLHTHHIELQVKAVRQKFVVSVRLTTHGTAMASIRKWEDVLSEHAAADQPNIDPALSEQVIAGGNIRIQLLPRRSHSRGKPLNYTLEMSIIMDSVAEGSSCISPNLTQRTSVERGDGTRGEELVLIRGTSGEPARAVSFVAED